MSELARKLIAENVARRELGEDASFLDLGRCGLTELPEELGQCVWVEVLVLSDIWYEWNAETGVWEWQKSKNPGEANRLNNLKGVEQLKQLSKLTTAGDFWDGWPLYDLSPLSELQKLQMLSCRNTQVQDLSPLAKLQNLQSLSCRNTQVQDLSPLSGLQNLQSLSCSHTQIQDLSPLSRLQNLKALSCGNTQVQDLKPLSKLQNLQSLDCWEARVQDLSPLASLHKLTELNFSGNQINDLTPILPLIKRGILVTLEKREGGISLHNNPLTNPPSEIAVQGNEVILRYFEEKARLEKQAQPVFIKVREAKVLIVGQGKSGKTSLRVKLKNPNAEMPAPGDTTRGIEITHLPERMPHSGESLRLNLWDFGGQNVQHFAHQLFLTGNALYILLTNERIQDQVHLPYWLHIIDMLGKKSPILLVQNMDGGHCEPLKNEASIQATFSNVQKPVYQTDISKAKTDVSFGLLRNKIIEIAAALPHIEKPYLRSFQELREKIEALAAEGKHYLTWGDYLALMPELSEDLMRDNAVSLTFLGVCQFFPEDAMLRNYIFLRPKWLIDALFDLILHPNLEDSRGYFSETDTFNIWKGKEYAGMHALLVRMMKEFELCYRVVGEGENYIVPQRLPGENETYGWKSEGDTVVRFEYKFLPKGILTRLICRMNSSIERDPTSGQRVWCDAVIFSISHGQGRVFAREVYSQNVIELRATGEKRTEILNQTIQTLDDIHNDPKTRFENLMVEKMVPCPCIECQNLDENQRHTFKFSVLEKAIHKNIEELRCDVSLDNVRVNAIFGKSGIKKPRPHRKTLGTGFGERFDDGWGLQEEETLHKLFISYSKHDVDHKDTLLNHLSGLRGKVATWHDRDIRPGEEWDASIQTALREADVVLYLVTHHSMGTAYIQNVELPLIEQRCRAKQCTLIPVVVDFCHWEDLDFAKYHALPEQDTPITDRKRWQNENEAWTVVVRGIKQICDKRQ